MTPETQPPKTPNSAAPANDPSAPHLKPPKNNAPIGIITFAIIVALALAAVAFYLYRSDHKTPTNTAANNNQQTVAPATTSDVDDASKHVDTAVNQLNDGQDFNSNDLSDSNLRL